MFTTTVRKRFFQKCNPQQTQILLLGTYDLSLRCSPFKKPQFSADLQLFSCFIKKMKFSKLYIKNCKSAKKCNVLNNYYQIRQRTGRNFLEAVFTFTLLQEHSSVKNHLVCQVEIINNFFIVGQKNIRLCFFKSKNIFPLFDGRKLEKNGTFTCACTTRRSKIQQLFPIRKAKYHT